MTLPFGRIDDPVFDEHPTGAGHPERPERTRRLRAALAERGFHARTVAVEPERADDAMLHRVHDPGYVRRVAEACARGDAFLDSMDVAIGRESERIARLAAGGLARLCRMTAAGELRGGFAAMRPPGHHAERDLAMGFCLYGNVAVAARELQARCGLRRILIVDWDVHHGNGTQHVFEDDPDVFFFSLHQVPLYPGTGMRHERGRGAGEGATLNCPLPPGAGDDAFLGALADELVPAADAFRPEFVLISAGFDAHRRDPLAQLEVTTPAYGEAARIVRGIAERHCGGKVVSSLEGGYDLDALCDAACAHLEGLLGDDG